MEYVPGENLEGIIAREGALDLSRALDYTCQIANAVDHAHKQGVLHRDLRPANVFVNEKGLLKVGDFGTSRILEVAAQLGFFLTPIMYRRSLFDSRGLGWVVDINPANLYISLIRDPILAGAPTTEGLAHLGQLYLPAGALTAVLVALAVGTVGWLQKKVIFHL